MTVLIPGFGTGLNSKILTDRYKNGGYFVFNKEIKANKAAVFVWTPELNLTWKESLSIPFFIEHYWRDREIVARPNVSKQLAAFLHHHKPDTIVAHSLGTELLWDTLKVYVLPETVKKIVFTQSDLPNEVESDHPLRELVANGDITLINTFSPADANLLLSSFLHSKPRAGLLGLDLAGCHNILLPWLGNLNIHSAPLSHEWFKEIVLSTPK